MPRLLKCTHWLLATLAVLALGCGTGSSTDEPDPDPITGPGPTGAPTLTIVGSGTLEIDVGTDARLAVRYTGADGRPGRNVNIEFDVFAQGVDTPVKSEVIQSDGNGMATLTIGTRGYESRALSVRASAEGARGVQWRIVFPRNPITLAGTYETDTSLDLIQGLNGPLGTAVRTLEDLTDDPADPTLFILDIIAEEADVPSFAAEVIAPPINNIILNRRPSIITELEAIARETKSVMSDFGMASQIRVTGQGPTQYEGTHLLRQFDFTIYGRHRTVTMRDLGVAPPSSLPFGITLDRNEVHLTQHVVPVPYGAVLRLLIDEVIVTGQKPDAESLYHLMIDYVPCGDFGSWAAYEVGRGSAGTWETACDIALSIGVQIVYSALAQIDCGDCELTLDGRAKVVEKDGLYEDFVEGGWMGTLELAATDYTLTPENATFTATRLDPATN